MPDATDVHLRPLSPPDVSAAEQLWAERFGGAPETHRKWIEAALDPTHSAAGVVAVTPDDTVVGISFLEVGGRRYTRHYLGLDALDIDIDVSLAPRNGLLHLTCVRTDWEGRGIGTAFYEHRLERLADRGLSRTFGIAWHRPSAPDSRRLFEKHGFTQLSTVERYYARTDSRPHCPVCDDTCTCTASLYGRSAPS